MVCVGSGGGGFADAPSRPVYLDGHFGAGLERTGGQVNGFDALADDAVDGHGGSFMRDEYAFVPRLTACSRSISIRCSKFIRGCLSLSLMSKHTNLPLESWARTAGELPLAGPGKIDSASAAYRTVSSNSISHCCC